MRCTVCTFIGPHEKFMANVVPMSESVAKLKEEKEKEEERPSRSPATEVG